MTTITLLNKLLKTICGSNSEIALRRVRFVGSPVLGIGFWWIEVGGGVGCQFRVDSLGMKTDGGKPTTVLGFVRSRIYVCKNLECSSVNATRPKRSLPKELAGCKAVFTISAPV